MYFDALECLPEDKDTSLTEEKCKPVSNSRKVGGGVAVYTCMFNLYSMNSCKFLVYNIYKSLLCAKLEIQGEVSL